MTTPSGSSLSTWLVIVGVFAAGALGGAAARSLVWLGSEGPRLSLSQSGDNQSDPPRERRIDSRRHEFGSGRFVKHLQESLELTPEQATRIGEILEERERETSALFEQIEPDVRETITRAESEIRDVLDADQQEKFDKIVKDGRKRFGSNTFRRGSRSRSSEAPPN